VTALAVLPQGLTPAIRDDDEQVLDIDWSFFNISSRQKPLMGPVSFHPVNDMLALAVIPQQLGLFVGHFEHVEIPH
jgi:hypothetical protein